MCRKSPASPEPPVLCIHVRLTNTTVLTMCDHVHASQPAQHAVKSTLVIGTLPRLPCVPSLCKAVVTLLLDELCFKCDTFVDCSCPQLTPSHLHGILAFSWDQVSSSPVSMRSMQPFLTSDLCNDKLVNWLLVNCLSCLPTHATALQSCISDRSSYQIRALPSQP